MVKRHEGETETRTMRRDPPLLRARPCVSWNDANGLKTAVIDRPMLVGTATKADLVMTDPTVSRMHAELDPRPDGLWVKDLGSHNGTFVEEIQVTSARVPDLARIRLGGTIITLRQERARAPFDVWPGAELGDLVGETLVMRELFATIVKLGATDGSVLISGETGSGKELVARAIHESGNRASKPFVVVDCGSLPENLIETELFGHVKGAFTGATTTRLGAIESAEGGTVFLDEIGELPLAMQPKLLRALESRTIRRIGEATYRKVDVRFLAATHRDLRGMANEGNFREDLFFRLAVLPLRVPPLRERVEDLPLLVAKFAPQMPLEERAKLCRELATRRLEGNVRELRNIVERASHMGVDESTLDAAFAQAESIDLALFDQPFQKFQEAADRDYLKRLLTKHRGSVAAASEAAQINRTYFHRLVKKYGL